MRSLPAFTWFLDDLFSTVHCNDDEPPQAWNELVTSRFARVQNYTDDEIEYPPSVLGMLLYLASNSRPDIAYATHMAARYTHAPTVSHEAAESKIAHNI